MATTAAGTPYVVSSDTASDYPTVSLSLANRIDTVESVADGRLDAIEANNWVTTARIASANVTLAKIAQEAWTSYTPTVSAATGTITTSSASGFYARIGNTVVARARVTITTAGTGAGALRITLPVTEVTTSIRQGGGFGREAGLSGDQLQAFIGSSLLQIAKYNNATPIASGAVCEIFFFYEAA